MISNNKNFPKFKNSHLYMFIVLRHFHNISICISPHDFYHIMKFLTESSSSAITATLIFQQFLASMSANLRLWTHFFHLCSLKIVYWLSDLDKRSIFHGLSTADWISGLNFMIPGYACHRLWEQLELCLDRAEDLCIMERHYRSWPDKHRKLNLYEKGKIIYSSAKELLTLVILQYLNKISKELVRCLQFLQ